MSVDAVEDLYPLTPLQQGLLFHSLYAAEAGVYVQQVSWLLRGALSVAAYFRAWQQVVDHYPVLRTAFVWEDFDEPMQAVFRHVELPVSQQDWRALAAKEQPEALENYRWAERRRGFTLTEAPLMRLVLTRLSDDTYDCTWTIHHLLLDGWSAALVIREVLARYEAVGSGRQLTLERPRPYRDYVAWLQQQDLAGAEAFWSTFLRGFTAPTPLPIDPDDRRADGQDYRYREQTTYLGTAATARLRALAREQAITLNSIIEGAWALLLSRHSGEQDIVFGVTVSTRPLQLAGSETMVGLFINTLPVRVQVPPEAPILPWLKRHQAQQVAARQYDYTPLEKIQRWSGLPRGASLFDTLMVFENYPMDGLLAGQGGSLSIAEARSVDETNYPLTLQAIPGPELMLRLIYEARRFDAAMIERLAGHLRMLLEGIAADPNRALSALPMLTAVEDRDLEAWNATAVAYPPEATLHGLVTAQALRTPEAVAVVCGPARLSYAELERRANQVARHLCARGVGPDVLVSVCMERSLELVVALLGVLKAGGAYVPLDPGYPAERLSFMRSDAGARVLLTQTRLAGRLAVGAGIMVCLDADWKAVTGEADGLFEGKAGPDNLAYMIYTSGSTGTPKGAMNSHRAICNRLRWMQDTYALAANERVLQKTPVSFDVSVWELFWPLLAGAGLVMAQPGGHQDPAYLRRIIAEERISTLHFVPSMLRAFLQEPELEGCLSLQRVLCSGEALPAALAAQCQARLPWTALHNLYGPTEAAVDVSAWACRPDDPTGTVPIGRPVANTRLYVLDRRLVPQPVGVPGELFIGGVQVGRGYRGRPALTAERFVPDPFGRQQGARLYRTGDLCCRRPDGAIEFLGRLDLQVKVRGFRVELGEIEAALLAHPALRSAAVAAREEQPGEVRLVAYLVGRDGAPPPAEALRAFLAERLPDYMLPTAFVVLDALPLSPNGKLDRRALPVPGPARPALAAAYIAPRTPVEQTLVAIWTKVLGLQQVGINDDFFTLGGDSILSLRIIARAAEAGLQLLPKHVFEHRTIAQLARLVQAGSAKPEASDPERSGAELPLTPIQRWFFEQELPDPHHFNQAVLLTALEPLDPVRLEQALQAIVARHDALRLRFGREGGSWRQTVAVPDQAPLLMRRDLSALPDTERDAAIAALMTDLQAGLNLERGPLLRAGLYILGPGRSDRLLVVAHHLAVDGVSWRILLEELAAIYGRLGRSEPVQLPPPPLSFGQWARRLAQHARTPAVGEELAYWLAATARLAPALPVDFHGGANTVASAETFSSALGIEETRALLQDVPRVYHTQVNDVLLTALAQAFAGWTGSPALLLDLEGHGRESLVEEVDPSRTVGWFTSIFPVRLDPGRSAAPAATLKAIKEQLRAVPQRGIGYGLLRSLTDDASAERLQAQPKAEVLFNYLGRFDQTVPGDAPFRLTFDPAGPPRAAAQRRTYLLEINGYVLDGVLTVGWTYSTFVHRQATIERLATHFGAALRALIAHCLSPDAGGFTPSDFALTRMKQDQLDRFVARARKTREQSPR